MKLTQMLLEWVLTSSFLILAVLALRALLGRRVSAGLKYALWAVVLVRLLVPVQLFTTPVTGSSVMRETGVEQWVTLPALPSDPIPAASPALAPAPTQLPDGTLIVYQPNPAPVTVKTQPIPSLRALGWLWLTGTAAMTAALVLSNLRFARRLRRMRIFLEGVSCPVPVYTALALPSPCLFGLFRPAVYLTPQTAEDPAMLRHVLAHETTHLRHFDHLWNVLRSAALALHWWNPLVWLSAVLSRRDCELACDEGALKRLGDGERFAYGRTLLALVTQRPRPRDLLRCATTMTGGQKSVFDRVNRIAKAPKRWLGAAVLAVVLAALACACAFGSAAEPDQTPSPSPGPSAPAEPSPLPTGPDWLDLDMDIPELLEHFPASMNGVPEDVVHFVGQVVQQRAMAYLNHLEEHPLTGQPIQFDGWRVQDLTGPWRGTAGGRELEVWQVNYEFHTTTPELAMNLVNGGAYLDDDGWLCPTYPNCTYAVFQANSGGKLGFLTDFTDNSVYPDGNADLFFARVDEILADAQTQSLLSGLSYTLDPIGAGVQISGLDCGGAAWQTWRSDWVLHHLLGLPEQGMEGVLKLNNPRFLGGYFAQAYGSAMVLYYPHEDAPLLFMGFDDSTDVYQPAAFNFTVDLAAGTVKKLETSGYSGTAPALSDEEMVGMARTLVQIIQGASDFYQNSLPAPEEGPLPFDTPMTLMFCSGAGAWRTILTLHPDGSFQGRYNDAEMGGTGEGFPFGTEYVCDFHGRFGNIKQVTDASWSLTLEELELDTDRPLGEEWIAERVKYISAAPHGLSRLDGEGMSVPLEPGAQFTLYAPDAKGYAPGDELYGMRESDDYDSIMYQFWTWWPDKRAWSPDSTLGRWGLCNMETGYGFFDLGAWGLTE